MKKRLNKQNLLKIAKCILTLIIISLTAVPIFGLNIKDVNEILIENSINYYTKSYYIDAFKKELSTLMQAAIMSFAQYEFDYSGATNTCQDGDNPEEGTKSFCALFNGTLANPNYVANLAELKTTTETSSQDYSIVSKSKYILSPDKYRGYILADGTLIGFRTDAASCSLAKGMTISQFINNNPNCIGFIDVNGSKLPNTEVSCANGDTNIVGSNCTVDSSTLGDIFPIVFHDIFAEPLTNAAQYVLNEKVKI